MKRCLDVKYNRKEGCAMIEETRELEGYSRVSVFINICAARLFPFLCIVTVVIVLGVISKQWVSVAAYRWLEIACGIVALLSVLVAAVLVANAWRDSVNLDTKLSSSSVVSFKIVIELILLSALFAFAYTVLLKMKYPNMQERGEFGDAFGAMNAIASSIALIGLWLTVWMQYRQMKEDRQRYAEERRVEEQQKADERLENNKKSWPAVVVSDISGRVGLVGVNPNGETAFRFIFNVVQKNCSNQVLINVVQSIQTSKSSDNTYLISLFANVSRYLDEHKTISADAEFYERSIAGDLTTDALADCDNRIVHVNIFICTIQKQYYFISHQFKVCISQNETAKCILSAWIDVLSTVKGRLAKHVGDTDLCALVRRELAIKKVGLNDIIELEFIPLPDKYRFIEISEKEYMAALNEKRSPCC